MPRGNADNLIPNSKRSPEELREMTRKGGIASGEARRRKSDLRKLFAQALDVEIQGKGVTHAERLVQSALNIAENPKNGAAAIRALETIMHAIGQDQPEPNKDALELLREILEENKKNARVQAEQEAE